MADEIRVSASTERPGNPGGSFQQHKKRGAKGRRPIVVRDLKAERDARNEAASSADGRHLDVIV